MFHGFQRHGVSAWRYERCAGGRRLPCRRVFLSVCDRRLPPARGDFPDALAPVSNPAGIRVGRLVPSDRAGCPAGAWDVTPSRGQAPHTSGHKGLSSRLSSRKSRRSVSQVFRVGISLGGPLVRPPLTRRMRATLSRKGRGSWDRARRPPSPLAGEGARRADEGEIPVSLYEARKRGQNYSARSRSFTVAPSTTPSPG